MNRNRLFYVLTGILLGAVIVMGIAFYVLCGRLQDMEKQAHSMEKTMKEALLQVQNGTAPSAEEESADVDAEYVDVNGEDEAKPTQKPKKTPTPSPESLSPADEFADLKPQAEAMLAQSQEQAGGEWSVYVENLDSGASMGINEKKMRAASLIKLFIMGAVYERYEDLAPANSNLDELLRRMITVSDNDAANELVTILGEGNAPNGRLVVDAFCSQYNYGSTSMGRMLLEENPSGENYTSAEDCGKFLYHVYSGEFKHSADMEALLKAQERRNKIPAGIPEGVEVANKTGELEDVQNDAAIVYGKTPYVVCILSEGISGEEGPVSAIRTLSSAIYGYLNQTGE